MSFETTSETTEQQVSSVEEDSPKQSEPDLPDIELPDDDPNKPTPSTSKNVLSNGLKRPLPDGVDGKKKKKLRLTEVSKLKANHDKLEITNKDDSGKNEIQILNKSSSSDTLAITENSDHENVAVVNDIQQFDSMCTQKFIAMMTASKYWGKYRSELQSFKKREKIWRSKYTSLFRQIKEMETIVNAYKQELQSNEYASLHKITGTVGLPAVACPKKKGSIKLPKQAIPMPKPDPVSISVEDDDDVVILEFEKEVTVSSSTSKITNTTTKKQKHKHSTSKTLVVSPNNDTASPKTVTASKSLNPINIGTCIDLTEDDDVIEESNIIDLEDSISHIKIPRRIPVLILPGATLQMASLVRTSKTLVVSPNNVTASPKTVTTSKSLNPINIGTSIDLTEDDDSGNSGKTITFLELSKNPSSSSSSFIMGTASRSPQRTIVLNKDTINTSPKSKNLKPVLAEVSRVESIHHTGSQSTRKPPAPAIPLLGHPSPVPGIPNQRSLPSWKILPPAPNLTINKSSEVKNTPQAVVLFWTMNVDKTIADVINYEIYSYQEIPDQPPNIELWKKIGTVKALPLPMTCSLSHFSNGQKYHFLVRAVDVYTRVGPFSKPESILYEDF